MRRVCIPSAPRAAAHADGRSLRAQEALRTQLKERLRRDGVESAKDLVAPQATPPRWVRANLLKVSSRSKVRAATPAKARKGTRTHTLLPARVPCSCRR